MCVQLGLMGKSRRRGCDFGGESRGQRSIPKRQAFKDSLGGLQGEHEVGEREQHLQRHKSSMCALGSLLAAVNKDRDGAG